MKNSLGRHWATEIEEAIRRTGLTKTKVAKRAKITVRMLNRWFEPDPPDPGFSKVVAVCRILGISVDSLLTPKQKAGVASSTSTAPILRTLATLFSDAAAVAEAGELAHEDEAGEQRQLGA